MGLYINILSDGTVLDPYGKIEALIEKEGAEILTEKPTVWEEGLVGVVETGKFQAAGYAFDQRELDSFLDTGDRRQVTWLKVPNAKDLAFETRDQWDQIKHKLVW